MRLGRVNQPSASLTAPLTQNTQSIPLAGAILFLTANDQSEADAIRGINATAGITMPTPVLPAAAVPMLYNTDTYDAVLNNFEKSLLASAVRAASTNSADQTNYNHRGVTLFLDVTVNGGGVETIQPIIQAKDPVSGNYVNLTAFAVNAFITPTTAIYQLYPGDTLTAAVTNFSVQGAVLPRIWRLRIVHSAASNWTYSVGLTYEL